jgi:tRNA A37 threonylcarbamoyltransferase TsaD
MTWQVEAGAREKAVRRNASPKFPLLALVISGGHTQIVRMSKHNDFEIIGATRDDAIGECFDKVAKILGLPYPGGPSIAKTAETGDSKKYPLPTPKVDGLDFSFSGLKTAVLRSVQKTLEKPISFPSHELAPLLTEQQKADFAASFQTTAINILLAKLEKSLKTHPNTKSLLLAGGVSANKELAKRIKDSFSDRVLSVPFFSPVKTTTFPDKDFEQACGACLPLPKSGQTKCCSFDIREQKISTESTLSEKLRIFIPNPQFSTDNAAMVGAAAFYESQTTPPTDPYALDTSPVAPLS